MIGGGVLALFTLLFAFVIKPGGGIVHVGAAWGVFVALAAALVATYGGFTLDRANPQPHPAAGSTGSTGGTA
jgi:hypothetical protein